MRDGNGDDRRELLDLLDDLLHERLDAEGHGRLQALLKGDVEAQRIYMDYLDTHLTLGRLLGPSASGHVPIPRGPARLPSGRWRGPAWGAVAAALLVAAAVGGLRFWPRGGAGDPPGTAAVPVPVPAPRLVQSSGARFFGGRTLPDGSRLAFGEDYALTEGMLELAFADGATAVIHGPAVFDVAGPARLIVKLGRCSVHAPEGAEGFRVETPVAEVVDLGTRFTVDVTDSGVADVQVVEGLAEVYQGRSAKARTAPSRLGAGQARRFAVRREGDAEEIAFDASRYTDRLPDRIVSYDVSGGEGDADHLESVTVQRGGTTRTYATADLIGIDLVHFRSTGGNANIVTPLGRPDPEPGADHPRARFALLDRDADLNSGVVNPGGSPTPLTSDPVIRDPEDPKDPNSPGLAVRFREPVVNADGPDVVFFELQVIVHPEKGDFFHVSPLRFRPGLKAHTVRSYDIDLASPHARTLSGFRLYRFRKPSRSLGELAAGRHDGGSEFPVPTKILAVGIDLSDLGYAPGETADGLFIQDAADDQNQVDPVFIAGLPPEGRPAVRGANP